MIRSLVVLIALFLTKNVVCQFSEKKVKLPKELREISGLEMLNDSILVAINDGGNKPQLFFITTKGKILHTSYIRNVVNTDWEDLTVDNKGNLYIADVGNNLNKRKDLKVLKVNLAESFKRDTVNAGVISLQYDDQTAFPTDETKMNFDCEAIYYQEDSLFLIAKNGSKPWNGEAKIYAVPTVPGSYTAKTTDQLFLGERGWMNDAVTSATLYEEELYVLTYTHVVVFDQKNGGLEKSIDYTFKVFTQKESIAIAPDKKIYVAAEGHRILGGPYLYTISKK